MPLQAVFFDIGATLVAPYPSFAAVFAETCRAAGVPLTDEEAAPIERRVAEELARCREHGICFSTSGESSRRFWHGLYASFLGEMGRSFPSTLPEQLYARFVASESYRAFPDVLPGLRALRERGLKLGVISNWEEWLERLLQDLGLLPYLDLIVVSGIEGCEKPNPELFRRALSRLDVAPAAALHVGDSPESDCAPALAAGMGAVLLDRDDRHPDSPYPRVRDLEELVAILDTERSRPASNESQAGNRQRPDRPP